MAEISVKKLAKDLNFDVICSGGQAKIDVPCADINRPGLFLSGFHAHFDVSRVQLIGTAEYSFLMSLDEKSRVEALNQLLSQPFPFLVLSNNTGDIPELAECAEKAGKVVFKSRTSTATRLNAEMASYLNNKLAPMETVHAVLLDIYGMGILLTGDSGIGKSEAALELVKRGHRLVADDAVIVKRISEHRLVGEAPEMIKHMMEIRGVGIINVEHMYGISAVIDSKSIDLVVHLEFWDKEKDYDRLGMEQDRKEILGVSVPLLTVPVHPGRNLAIIMESAARNTRLKQAGYNALDEIKERQAKMLED
ncbi:MAG: HPr(Ser) kinase/phosphatase [Clostridia bacterium]|nr:HPr(Ser) kinase/phosphatase [Clostridia bacterium]